MAGIFRFEEQLDPVNGSELCEKEPYQIPKTGLLEAVLDLKP
jgi:hypothetical protein